MAANLAGKTYEVQTGLGGKWTYEETFEVKSQAIQKAQVLLESHKYEGVRVIAESERGGEEVIFEEASEVKDKGLTIVPVERSPVCDSLGQLYQFEARRTAGKLLRQYLDDIGMTAMELAFDFGRLRMLERDDKLYLAAMSRLANIQAKTTGEKPADRQGKLERLFNQLKDKAQAFTERTDLLDKARDSGLEALIQTVNSDVAKEERHPAILAGLAAVMGEQGGWDGKLEVLIGMLGDKPSVVARAYIDEAMAEVLDGAAAVGELLGGVADAAQAHRMLALLSQGRLPEVKNPLSCINTLNATFARFDLENARTVLLERVAAGLRGVKPLTREGKAGDMKAFSALVGHLAGPVGVIGGDCMAEAVTMRAQIAMSGGDADLTAEEAIASIGGMMKSAPARVGYLLDLSATEFGTKHQQSVIRSLAAAMRGLGGGSGLGADAATLVAELHEKIGASGLPAELKKTASATLDKLVGGAAGGAAPAGGATAGAPAEKKWETNKSTGAAGTPAGPVTERVVPSRPAGGGERRQLVKGQILFEEGDAGHEAYLISSGSIEIFRRGAIDTVLATLGPGEILGEMSLIDDAPRAASARSGADTDLIVLSKDSLKKRLERLDQTDKVLRRLMDVLVNRLRASTATNAE